jgi:hypothetical protein
MWSDPSNLNYILYTFIVFIQHYILTNQSTGIYVKMCLYSPDEGHMQSKHDVGMKEKLKVSFFIICLWGAYYAYILEHKLCVFSLSVLVFVPVDWQPSRLILCERSVLCPFFGSKAYDSFMEKNFFHILDGFNS